MSIEIDVLNGDASWPRAEPLMQAVWPREAIEKLSWGHIKWAHADLRVLIDAPEDAVLPAKVLPAMSASISAPPPGTGARSRSAASAAFRRGRIAGGAATPRWR